MTDRVVEGPPDWAELLTGRGDPGSGALVVLTAAAGPLPATGGGEVAVGAEEGTDRLLAELEEEVLRVTGARRCRIRLRPDAPPGEPAVAVAVRAAHRREAFEAARGALSGVRARLPGGSDAP